MKKVYSHLLESSRVAEESVARSYSIFRWAVSFIVCVTVFIVALEGWRLVQDYKNAFLAATDAASNLTRAASQQADDTFRQVDSLLVGLREWIESDGLDRRQADLLHRLLVEQLGRMPQLHGLSVFDERGLWRASDGNGPLLTGTDARDREYFIYHQSHLDRELHIGAVIESSTGGEKVIPLSRRLDRPDGSFAGVFVGTIKVSYLANYYSDFKVGPKGVFVLALRTGEVLVRSPSIPGTEGKSLSTGEVFQNRLPSSSEGVVQMKSLVDNQSRLFGYKALRDFPLVIEAGISYESIIKGWQRDLTKSVVVVLIMLLGVGAFSIFFLQQLRSKIELAKAVHLACSALQEIAMYDDLTKLANRRQLDKRLKEEVVCAAQFSSPLSLIMLDIDFFKQFNDLYGHFEGDDCLRQVAKAVLNAIRRPGDLAARYGGEEIAILLPNTDSEEAAKVVQRILKAIRDLNVEHGKSPFGQVTASAGVFVSRYSETNLTPEKMIREADAQLYLAKQDGRNRWRIAPSD